MDSSNSYSDIFNIVKFYDNNIKDFEYNFTCRYNMELKFSINPDNLCHLIFGSMGTNIPNAKEYKGIKGYENIKSGKIRTVPIQIRKDSHKKIQAFKYLPELLKKPKIFYFNKDIVDIGNIKGLKTTQIDAEFMLFKEIDSLKIHFFLKWVEKENKLVPYSLLHNRKSNYIANQKEIKLIELKKRRMVKENIR